MRWLNKQKTHLSNLYTAKREQLIAEQSLDYSENNIHGAYWERLAEDEKRDINISDFDNDFVDESYITVKKFIENILWG